MILWQVNFSAFNSTYEVDTPLCSSRDLEVHYKNRARMYKRSRTLPPMMAQQQSSASILPKISVTDESQGTRYDFFNFCFF